MTSPREKRLSLPQRTSKTAQKLKLLPEDSFAPAVQITDTTARRDAERLGKAERAMLPRVTAYCTASNYRMDAMFTFLQSRYKSNGTLPKQFDECIYSPYTYTGEDPQRSVDLLELEDPGEERDLSFPSMKTITPEVFIFEYGVIVFWSMSVNEEKRFLKEIQKFEVEKLAEEDVEVEEFNYYVTQLYQPRIYNDFITLRDGSHYMVKLSISHAIAQSVKISLFEELIDDTIEATKDIPQRLADTGKVNMSRKKIMMSVGELFILRININLVSSVVDSPELMWSEPQLEPVYQAARSYLEINQRVSLLNQRVQVISDLLSMLKEQMAHSHGEYLEWIVIFLIAAEILIAVANILVDIFASGG